jgi:hypothetical protein
MSCFKVLSRLSPPGSEGNHGMLSLVTGISSEIRTQIFLDRHLERYRSTTLLDDSQSNISVPKHFTTLNMNPCNFGKRLVQYCKCVSHGLCDRILTFEISVVFN